MIYIVIILAIAAIVLFILTYSPLKCDSCGSTNVEANSSYKGDVEGLIEYKCKNCGKEWI